MQLKIKENITPCPSLEVYVWKKFIIKCLNYISFAVLLTYCALDSLNVLSKLKTICLYIGLSINFGMFLFLHIGKKGG